MKMHDDNDSAIVFFLVINWKQYNNNLDIIHLQSASYICMRNLCLTVI